MIEGENRFAGRRLGPYELRDAIGAGGMGEVYRASRADAEYQQQVAIKLVRAGLDIAFISARLRAERQILATLAHPNIARLLDGGTTPDGIPYLVMELIDGVPIDHYCEEHRLDVPARLKLFIEVCSAVQYAHRRMIIHRDLKPRNILVTREGVPKLLDFGVAKILDPGALPNASDVTLNAQRLLTPGYASPEQLSGELITSASDVYSLGVILYELLTGVHPYATTRQAPLEMLRAQLDAEPPKPSRMTRRRFRDDLDNIVLMALRKEPERRYATVEQFAEDIRRYLQRQPVIAHRSTFSYRLSVFVTRHRFAVGAAIVVALLLMGGIVVTWHEARLAEAQRARAEQRFDEVRKLANSLIFDIHDSIRFLSGATESRRLLSRTAARYLDSLAQDAVDDPSLQRDLAAAYERLGDVQGQPREVNEGDYVGAMQSYQRALALRLSAAAAEPHNLEARRDVLVNYGKLSDLSWNSGEPGRALDQSRQTIANAEMLVAADANNKVHQRLLAVSLGDYGYKLFKIRGDTTAALPYMRRSIAGLEALAAADPTSASVGRVLALIYSRTAEMLQKDPQQVEEALSLTGKAQKVLQPLVARSPQNMDLRHLAAFSDLDISEVLLAMGRLDSAAQHAQAALDAFRALVAADPKIAEYSHDSGRALAVLADIAEKRGDPAQAISLLRTALNVPSPSVPPPSVLPPSVPSPSGTAPGADARNGTLPNGLARNSIVRANPVPNGTAAASGSGPANGYFRLSIAHEEALYGKAFTMLAADEHLSASERQKDWQSARDAYGEALKIYEELLPSWAEAAAGARLASGEIQHCERVLRSLSDECSPTAAALATAIISHTGSCPQ